MEAKRRVEVDGDHPKDTKTFWIQKIRKPSRSKRYKNLLDPRSRSEISRGRSRHGTCETDTARNARNKGIGLVTPVSQVRV